MVLACGLAPKETRLVQLFVETWVCCSLSGVYWFSYLLIYSLSAIYQLFIRESQPNLAKGSLGGKTNKQKTKKKGCICLMKTGCLEAKRVPASTWTDVWSDILVQTLLDKTESVPYLYKGVRIYIDTHTHTDNHNKSCGGAHAPLPAVKSFLFLIFGGVFFWKHLETAITLIDVLINCYITWAMTV